MSPQTRYHTGDRIGGRFQVHQVLKGGMGEVYLCLELEQHLPIALKTLQARYLTKPRMMEYFNQEVTTWIEMENHPHIVRCFHMRRIDNQPFLVLEWIAGDKGRGNDLRQWLQRGRLDVQQTLQIGIDICRGLVHAQEKQPGLVHRDLKPENILMAQAGVGKITDFGLATVVERAGLEIIPEVGDVGSRQSIMIQHGVVGTVQYMAPEQWLGEESSPRTDLYALGCIIHEMLTGVWPYRASTREEFRFAHLEGAIPELPSELKAPRRLAVLIAGCMAKQPNERPASAQDVLQELEHIYRLEFGDTLRTLPVGQGFTTADFNNRAATYIELELYQNALPDLEKATEIDPNYSPAFINRGFAYLRLRQYEAALTAYSEAIGLDPSDASSYNDRGFLLGEMGQHEAELKDYDQATRLDPNYAKAYYNRGVFYADRKEYKKALKDFNQAINSDPHYIEAYVNRGNTLRELGRFESALDDYTTAIELEPTSAVACYNRGDLSYQLGSYERALADFNRAIDLNPGYALAYLDRGNTHFLVQRYVSALKDYERALELMPDDSKVYYNRGLIFAALGRLEDAATSFESAAQLGDGQAAEKAELVRQATIEAEELDAIFGLQSENPPDLNAIGQVLYEEGLYDQALVYYNRAIDLDPDYMDAYAGRGLVFDHYGYYENALADFEKAAELGDELATVLARGLRGALKNS